MISSCRTMARRERDFLDRDFAPNVQAAHQNGARKLLDPSQIPDRFHLEPGQGVKVQHWRKQLACVVFSASPLVAQHAQELFASQQHQHTVQVAVPQILVKFRLRAEEKSKALAMSVIRTGSRFKPWDLAPCDTQF